MAKDYDEESWTKWNKLFEETYPKPEPVVVDEYEALEDASYACFLARRQCDEFYSYRESINWSDWRKRLKEWQLFKSEAWGRVKIAFQHNPFQTMRLIDKGELKPWRHM